MRRPRDDPSGTRNRTRPSEEIATAIGAFVAHVSAELDDLAAEDVEDLTSWLEADLADLVEQASEAGTPGGSLPDLGTPQEYAAELRSAAGPPPRGAEPGGPAHRRGLVAAVRASIADSKVATRTRWAEFVEHTPWAPRPPRRPSPPGSGPHTAGRGIRCRDSATEYLEPAGADDESRRREQMSRRGG